MRTKQFITIIGGILLASLAASVAVSCGDEPVLDNEKVQALVISPALLDIQNGAIKTRALGEDDLKDDKYNENVVNRLDVFFFKKTDGSFVKAYHVPTVGVSPEVHGTKEGYLLSNDWVRDGLVVGTAYTVYIVANSTNETINSTTSTTLSALQELVLEDEDIYKRQGTTSDNTYTTSKAFLMNALVDSWTILAPGTQQVNDAEVTLTRAAVKFVMDVSLSEDFLSRLTNEANEQYGAPSWKYVNFNTVTREVPGSTTALDPVLKTAGSGKFLTVEQGTGDNAGHYYVVTYGYPHEWTSETAADKAPGIFLSFPSRPIGSPNATPAYHYYFIPLCAQATNATVSNNLYKVNAIISSYGSTEAITSSQLNLNYEVMPWGTSYSADIEANTMEYLLVTPITYSFKGGSTSTPLHTTIKYYASGTVTIDGITAYYIDKNGDTQTVNSGFNVGDPSNGEIVVSSTVPTNSTFRSIEFTVKCGTKSQVVHIRHYPLDFITAEDGAYSTYDYEGWVKYGTSGTYISSGFANNRFTFYTSGTNCFGAKVFSNNNTCYLTSSGGVGEVRSQNANNQMYVLQLTSSNDTYVLGRPNYVAHTGSVYRSNSNTPLGTITYYTSNDDVISPAFMLGSQLASLNNNNRFDSAESAAMHCALYKEVSNGVEYTGWRLPTRQEIQYMVEKQNSDAMDKVLSARSYWCLDGTAVTNPAYSAGDYTSTRCVRDLDKAELDEINKFE